MCQINYYIPVYLRKIKLLKIFMAILKINQLFLLVQAVSNKYSSHSSTVPNIQPLLSIWHWGSGVICSVLYSNKLLIGCALRSLYVRRYILSVILKYKFAELVLVSIWLFETCQTFENLSTVCVPGYIKSYCCEYF